MLTYLTTKWRKIADRYFTKAAPVPAPIIVCDANETLTRIVDHITKMNKAAMEKQPVPTDTIETIMFRSGARWHRDELLREIQNVINSRPFGR